MTLLVTNLYAQKAASKTPQPEIFQRGIISTGDFDTHIEFTPDQKQIFFLRLTPDYNLFWTMFESHLVKGKWSTAQIVPFFRAVLRRGSVHHAQQQASLFHLEPPA